MEEKFYAASGRNYATEMDNILLGIDDLNLNFFIFEIFFYAVKQCFEAGHAKGRSEDAALGVFGFCAHMDADSFTVGYILQDGQEFPEARWPGEVERIGAGGDDEIGIFEGIDRDGSVFFAEGYGIQRDDHFAGYGFAAWAISM